MRLVYRNPSHQSHLNHPSLAAGLEPESGAQRWAMLVVAALHGLLGTFWLVKAADPQPARMPPAMLAVFDMSTQPQELPSHPTASPRREPAPVSRQHLQAQATARAPATATAQVTARPTVSAVGQDAAGRAAAPDDVPSLASPQAQASASASLPGGQAPSRAGSPAAGLAEPRREPAGDATREPAATAAAAPKTLAISAVSYLVPPELIYPQAARRAQEEGRVLLRVLVDAQGRPAQLAIARGSGYARLDEAALAAARLARFKPYSENGLPQAFWVQMPFVFELES